MKILPQTDCCSLLGIDPKTLRNWLRHANMQFVTHPTDARLKCLTQVQVQQLAALHGRPMELPAALAPPLLAVPEPPRTTDLALLEPPRCPSETDLLTKLSHLETQVTTMQQQLAQLALELLQERTLRYEQRLQTLEALLQHTERQVVRPPALQTREEELQQGEAGRKERGLHPAELRARSRLIPLIEYGAGGSYVVICPQDGELHLTPDSPAWFDWLATLSSFRSLGKQGRFSAYRKGRMSRRWSAYRTIHQHSYQHYLGTTDHLTIDCLEQMAATLQSYMAAL